MVNFVTQTPNVKMSNVKPFRHFAIVINKRLITERKFIETCSIKTRITPKGGIGIHRNTVNMKIQATLDTRYFRLLRRSNFVIACSTHSFLMKNIMINIFSIITYCYIIITISFRSNTYLIYCLRQLKNYLSHYTVRQLFTESLEDNEIMVLSKRLVSSENPAWRLI